VEGYLIAEVAEEVGLPPGVLNVVTADREVSELLVRDPRVDKITFTGSTAAGRKIASPCGERHGAQGCQLSDQRGRFQVLTDFLPLGRSNHRLCGGNRPSGWLGYPREPDRIPTQLRCHGPQCLMQLLNRALSQPFHLRYPIRAGRMPFSHGARSGRCCYRDVRKSTWPRSSGGALNWPDECGIYQSPLLRTRRNTMALRHGVTSLCWAHEWSGLWAEPLRYATWTAST
jgi:hypothetical protein